MAFKKDNIPWNKGIKYDGDTKAKLNLSGLDKGRGLYKGLIRIPSYPNIHYWVRTNKGNPVVCEICGITTGRLEWANKDHKYKHNLDDYFSLCKKCHTKHDYDNHLSNKGSRGGSIPNKMKGGNCGV